MDWISSGSMLSSQERKSLDMHLALFDGNAPVYNACAQHICVVARQANGELTLGDVITGVNGKTIKAQKDLFGALDELKVGDKVQLEI